MTPEQRAARPLRLACLEQIKAYCTWAQAEGAYYGNAKHFHDRHAEILAWLDGEISRAREARAPKRRKK